MKLAPPCLILLLPGCSQGQSDWRAAVVADAKTQVEGVLGQSRVQFRQVQVTGDSSTGQTCGKVFGDGVSDDLGRPARFIVYIDKSAGPWVEGHIRQTGFSNGKFEYAWRADCVGEGWKGN